MKKQSFALPKKLSIYCFIGLIVGYGAVAFAAGLVLFLAKEDGQWQEAGGLWAEMAFAVGLLVGLCGVRWLFVHYLGATYRCLRRNDVLSDFERNQRGFKVLSAGGDFAMCYLAEFGFCFSLFLLVAVWGLLGVTAFSTLMLLLFVVGLVAHCVVVHQLGGLMLRYVCDASADLNDVLARRLPVDGGGYVWLGFLPLGFVRVNPDVHASECSV